MIVDSDKTKLQKLLTLPKEAHIIIRNERLQQYEHIIEAAQRGEEINALVVELRKMEPKQ